VDNVLNQEILTEIQVIVDNSPPASAISFLEPKYMANASSDILNITNYTPINITSLDQGVVPVGLDFIEYMVDDDFDQGNGNVTGWINYSGLFELTGFADGDYQIYYHAVDLLGNIEAVKNITIIVDSTPPVSEFRIEGVNYSTQSSRDNDTWWIRPDSIINLSTEDLGILPVGNNITMYWINGVLYGNFSDSITFDLGSSPNGTHILEFRGTDFLTNTEPLWTVNIIIDDAGPDMDLIAFPDVTLPSILPQNPTEPIIFSELTSLQVGAQDKGVPPGETPVGVWYIEYYIGDPNDPNPLWQNLTTAGYNIFDLIGNWSGDPTSGYWHNNISFRSVDNLGQMGPKTRLWIYIEGDTEPPIPPLLWLEVDDEDIMLHWTPSTSTDIHHYLIYRSSTKLEFDFNLIWHNTASDIDNGILPLRTTWNDTEAISLFSEYYYIIRGVDQRGNIGYTSNIAGWITMTFEEGYNAFSLPLEPFKAFSASEMLNSNDNFGDDRDTLYRYDTGSQGWMGHGRGMPAALDDFTLIMDESYMLYIAEKQISYTFIGTPGTSIRYIDGVGEDEEFRKSLVVEMDGEDVVLSWDTAEGAGGYAIYRGEKRFGEDSMTDYDLVPIATVSNQTTTWIDEEATQDEYYYLVVAQSDGKDQASTYALGVRTFTMNRGYSSFSFTLDPQPTTGLGSLAQEKLSDKRDTIYYYHRKSADWQGHPKLLPENINTGNVVMGNAYLVFTHGETTKIAIIGT
jgi:hypothetical protein